MSRPIVPIAVGLMLISMVGCYLIARDDSAKEIARLRMEIAALKKQQDAQSRAPQPARTVIIERPAIEPTSTADPKEPPEPALSEEPNRPPDVEAELNRDPFAEEEAELRKERARMLQKFKREPVDPQWAPDFAQEIREALESRLPPGSTLLRVECRTSLCVAELRYGAGYDGGDAILGAISEYDAPLSRRAGGMMNFHLESTPLEHTILIGRKGVRDWMLP